MHKKFPTCASLKADGLPGDSCALSGRWKMLTLRDSRDFLFCFILVWDFWKQSLSVEFRGKQVFEECSSEKSVRLRLRVRKAEKWSKDTISGEV